MALLEIFFISNIILILSISFSLFFFISKEKQKKNSFNQPLESGFKNIDSLKSNMSIFLFFHIILFIILDLEISISIFFSSSLSNFNSPMMMLFFLSISAITILEWKILTLEWLK